MTDGAPVFITASVRSGSTMLKLMLDHHPAISNPGECDFLFDHVANDGALPTSVDYETALRLNRIYQAKRLHLDTSLPYLDIMESFSGQLLGNQKVLTMNVHRNFYRIPFVFPNARYIHLNRDPRDVANSCVNLGWAGHVYYGVDIWMKAQESWAKLRENLEEDQYMEIRFEDLIFNVETGLTEICNFLGLEYSEQMLKYPESTNYELPDEGLCYQWKRKLSKQELQLVEGKVGEAIVKNGYPLSGYDSEIPGPTGNFMLKLMNRIRRTRYQFKKYGAILHLTTLFGNRLRLNWLQNICQKRRNNIDILHLK